MKRSRSLREEKANKSKLSVLETIEQLEQKLSSIAQGGSNVCGTVEVAYL